ncbi:efflux RND transporter permease subunit [Agaribacterium haliotis]|uniref:efflux RND transporter permease subunit n=1 Tax=Agaribacterium haliotis TaxID=2013869 RepID=UPI000BB52BAE|nr:MMPL family transporter [Agaribacterium haliotis]
MLICLLALALFLAAGLPNFKLDASADSLTLENDSDLEFFREVSKRFDSGDFLVVTFKPEHELFSDASLALLAQLQQELSTVEGVQSINSILNVPLLFSPRQSLAELAMNPRTLGKSKVDYQLARKEFWTSPIYKKLILGPQGQTTALQLNLKVDHELLELVRRRDRLRADYAQNPEHASALADVEQAYLQARTRADAEARLRVKQVREIVARYQDRAQIFVGGVSMIAADMIAFIQSDLLVFGIAVVLFMIAVLALIFRAWKFVFVPMLCCLTAVLMMLGYVSWLDWRLTVISSNFVALLLIISLSIIIHLVVRYRELEQQHPLWPNRKLVKATVMFMARPCFYTAVTTIVAFASLVVSGIRPVIDFGWMMTLGLGVALSLAFLILPAALTLFPRQHRAGIVETSPSSPPFTYYFACIVERHGRLIVVSFAALFLLALWGIKQLQVENRFVDYFHEKTEIYQGLTVIDNKLGGTISLDLVINAAEQSLRIDEDLAFADDDFADESWAEQGDGFDDAFADESFAGDDFDEFAEDDPFSETGDNMSSYWMTVGGLKQVEWLHDYLESLPEVGKVQSLATLYKVGRDINGSLNDFELALMQRVLSDDVRSVLISPYLSEDGMQTRLTLRVIDTYPGLSRSEFVQRIQKHIADSAPFAKEQSRMTGLLVLYNNMLQSLFSSQILTLAVVFLAIYLMLALLFKSFVLATIAIIPNIAAAFYVLGGMGWLGIPLDMMTITVAAITVGIGVDHTIHYIHRYRGELALDGDALAAMRRSHLSIGRAMYYTAVIIIFGFGIMVLSRFIPTIYFGLLTGFAMFVSLLGSLLLLPRLLMLPWLRRYLVPKSNNGVAQQQKVQAVH